MSLCLFSTNYNDPMAHHQRKISSTPDSAMLNNRIIDQFVESVNAMNEVVLVPSKLQDLPVDDQITSTAVSTRVSQMSDQDLYKYFKAINSVKNDLFVPKTIEDDDFVFTPKRKISSISSMSRTMRTIVPENTPMNTEKHHHLPTPPATPMRKLSQESSHSVKGISSHSRSSSGSGLSLLETLPPPMTTEQLSVQFFQHLNSLYDILNHFTQVADYITQKYVQDVAVDCD